MDFPKQIRYLPCPVCGKLMNRINFANFSSVIVDVCREHGTWFDRDELRRIVEFIRAGGIEGVGSGEIANLEEDRRVAAADRMGRLCAILHPDGITPTVTWASPRWPSC